MTNQREKLLKFKINDFGYFPFMPYLQYKAAVRNIDGLVHAVTAAFDAFSPDKLNDTFLTLQKCMVSSLFKNGGSTFKQPDLPKNRRCNSGKDIKDLICDSAAF